MTSTKQPSLNQSFPYQAINNSGASLQIPLQQSVHYSRDDDMAQQTEGYVLNVSTSDNSENVQYCLICNDKATGKHYGAYSCDGCKGFFRRSVRKKSNYTCQYNRSCKMDKDKRNQCRYCRLKKCILVGMKRAAVQNERDRISTRRSSFDDIPPNMLLSISQLMQAEQRIAVQKIPHTQEFMHRLADVPDVCESMKNQLFLLVNWAKTLPCFSQLSLNDQIALLKAHAGEILILGVIKRSFQLDEDDVLLLGNNLIISRNSGDKHFAEIASHILDDLFIPLRELQLDEAEFTCLKAIVFFDPTVAVSDSSKEFIRRCRYQIQMDLMNHMNDKQYHKPGRFGELLLSIPDLRYVTQMMVKKVEFMKMTGLAEIDSLLSETLLGDNTGTIFDIQSNSENNNNNNNSMADGYNPPNSSTAHSSRNYDPIHHLRAELQSPPMANCHNLYGIPSFMQNPILLDINNQNISQETANNIWRSYPEHIYNAFANQESMQHSQQDARLINNMLINSDGIMLKSDSVGMPTLFSTVNDTIGLYQHSGNIGHDSANFLVNLDQNFQILSQQQPTKYGHKGDGGHGCGNNSNSDDLMNQSDPHNLDPSLMVTYSKSLPNSPVDNCQIQSMSNLNGDPSMQHKPMTLYSINTAAHLLSDQHQRKGDAQSSMFKSEDY